MDVAGQPGVETVAEDVGFDERRDGPVEAIDVGEAAAEHDDVGVEEVDDDGKNPAEAVLVAGEGLDGGRVAVRRPRQQITLVGAIRHRLGIRARRRLRIERVNGDAAVESPWLPLLREAGFAPTWRGLADTRL